MTPLRGRMVAHLPGEENFGTAQLVFYRDGNVPMDNDVQAESSECLFNRILPSSPPSPAVVMRCPAAGYG